MKKVLIMVVVVALVLSNIFALVTCIDCEIRVSSLAKKYKALAEDLASLEKRESYNDDMWDSQITLNDYFIQALTD